MSKTESTGSAKGTRKTSGKVPAPTARSTPKAKALVITVNGNQTNAEAVAAKLLGPVNRHGNLAPLFGGAIGQGLPDQDKPGIVEYAHELRSRFEKVRGGDMGEASDLLVAQALTLDGIFTEMARRAANNFDQYFDATERYMRLALKAQASSRATLEALAKLHQPREPTVPHVHVSEGGQAIVADQFHHHAGGQENGQSVDQSHATGAAGRGAALPSPDAIGPAVPVPGREGEAPVPNARWDESGRARRKFERLQARSAIGGNAASSGGHQPGG